MREKKVKKELNSVEKLYILLQPYIRKREITAILQCSAKKAADIFDSVLLGMKQKNYRILDYTVIPTQLFMAYCQIEIEDFIKSADIELQLNRKAQKR